MKRLSLLTFSLLAALSLIGTACGGDDDADGDDGGSGGTATQAADSTATEAAGDNSSNGGGNTDTDGEFFQISGSGVLTVVIDGETHEFDVTCSADKGKTLGDEPQWDYTVESAASDIVIQGTYQVIDQEVTYNSLLVNGGDIFFSAQELTATTSGGTEWAGSFTAVGGTGPIEGTFETSCS
jgi:hypothetical protein